MYPFRTILHPTDYSENSESAFRLACSFAREHRARLIIVHVVPPRTAAGRSPQMLETLKEQLRQLRPEDPNIIVDHHLVDGDPADEIIREARAAGCDVIILGTHGRTGLKRLLTGSVAERVLRGAPCPVVTIRVPEAEQPTPELARQDDAEVRRHEVGVESRTEA
jgi:nucleotide-binding universal stress UspA family protein